MAQVELNKLLTELLLSWENEEVEFKSGGSGYSTDDIGEYYSALSNEASLRHVDQFRRGFPLQDYDQQPDSVTVTIYGHIIDNAYSTLLLMRTNLDLDDIVLLDRIQKKLEVSPEGLKKLRALHLIAGRRHNVRIDANVADAMVALQDTLTCMAGAQVAGAQVAGAQVAGAQVAGAQVAGAQVAGGQMEQNETVFSAILRHLASEVMSRVRLAALQDVERDTGSFRRAFSQLLVLGFIERTQRNPRAPNQAYRITEKGRVYLEAHSKQMPTREEKKSAMGKTTASLPD